MAGSTVQRPPARCVRIVQRSPLTYSPVLDATLFNLPKSLPRIIVGTVSLGSLLWPSQLSGHSKAEAMRLLDEFIDLGCTAFDTAPVYQLGGSERFLGDWSSQRRNRDRLFLITKCAHPNLMHNSSRFNVRAITQDLHASLRRLRTDTIDLYLLHRDDPSRPFAEILDLLASFRREGKIRAFGVSNWTTTRIGEATHYLHAHGLAAIAASSPHFSLLEWARTPWRGCVSIAGLRAQAARDFHTKYQMPVLAWSPLGQGFFSDRISETSRPGPFNLGVHTCLKRYGSLENFARRRRAKELAWNRGVSAAQIALAYLFSHPFPVFAVVASSSAARMRENVAASELRLPPAEIAYLESGIR
jgi:aryl-alcohol dehydrogenase-like predicted oxidoreductase